MIPCQIFSACLLFSNVELMNAPLVMGDILVPCNLSLVLITSLCLLYAYMDLMGGILTAFLWTPLLLLGNLVHSQSLLGGYEGLAALGLFVSTFSVQVGLGHGVFEEGRDDTEQNVGELLRTWNPVYVSCIPFYHHMEILFNAGLRPSVGP